MTVYHHQGHNINVSGHGSIDSIGGLEIGNQVAADPQAAMRELAGLITALKNQVTADDRQILNESVRAVQISAGSDKNALRRALSNVVGIASMAGALGAPVLDAALKVKELFGV